MLRAIQLGFINTVPSADESSTIVGQEAAEREGHLGCMEELEDETLASDAELESGCRSAVIERVRVPLNAEAYNELVAAKTMVMKDVGKPSADYGRSGGDCGGNGI